MSILTILKRDRTLLRPSNFARFAIFQQTACLLRRTSTSIPSNRICAQRDGEQDSEKHQDEGNRPKGRNHPCRSRQENTDAYRWNHQGVDLHRPRSLVRKLPLNSLQFSDKHPSDFIEFPLRCRFEHPHALRSAPRWSRVFNTVARSRSMRASTGSFGIHTSTSARPTTPKPLAEDA